MTPMHRLTADELPELADLLDRWNVWIDETGRGPWIGRPIGPAVLGWPLAVQGDNIKHLRKLIEGYESQRGTKSV
jgi:hypothetical protein